MREAYRRFLELDAGDPEMRAEALRRLADLELESADAERGDGTTAAAGGEQTRAAIALYERLLAEAPDHPRIDSVLYQLGRAWEAEGDAERALSYLDRLVANYPNSRHIEEAHFRRGEILFSARRWPEAEAAYEAVIRRGSGTAFQEQALYKHGWSLFKQSRIDESSVSFMAVLDRKLLSSPGVEIESLDKLSRADRELVEDTMRVLGIQFTADDPAGALTVALAKHDSPAYGWRLHASLGDLLVEKERYTDAADTYRAYAAQHPGDAHSPVLQGRAIEAYLKGGFAELALEGKREYVELYAFDGPFWATRTRESAPEVVAQLKANLRDLAQHHHALAQKGHKAADYQQAARWYRDLLQSFPDEPDTAETNYLLADLLFESGQFREAAIEYERTAYDRPSGPRSGTRGLFVAARLRSPCRVPERRGTRGLARAIDRKRAQVCVDIPGTRRSTGGAGARDAAAVRPPRFRTRNRRGRQGADLAAADAGRTRASGAEYHCRFRIRARAIRSRRGGICAPAAAGAAGRQGPRSH